MTATDEQADEIAALRAALAALMGWVEAQFDGRDLTLAELDDMAAGGNRLAAAMAQGRRATGDEATPAKVRLTDVLGAWQPIN